VFGGLFARPVAPSEMDPIRKQPRIQTGAVIHYLPGAWFWLWFAVQCFPPAVLSGFSRTLFAAKGLPASAAIDVLRRGRPIPRPKLRRKRTTDRQIRRSAASQEKTPRSRQKFTNFADVFPEYYMEGL